MRMVSSSLHRIARLGGQINPTAFILPNQVQATEPTSTTADIPGPLRVVPVTGTFGARIENVDIGKASPEEMEQMRQALYQRKVLIIDGQDHIGPQQLKLFSEELVHGKAETIEHPNHNQVDDCPGVYIIRPSKARSGAPQNEGPYGARVGGKVGAGWHADGSRSEMTQVYSFLHAKDVPPYGRDTMYADTEAAFQRLSPSLREYLQTLEAQHHWSGRGGKGMVVGDQAPVKHPVIMTDEEGRKSIYVNGGYTQKILGLRNEESDLLLDFLLEQSHVPELQLRASWKPGTLVVWDNEKTHHYAVKDEKYDRIMHRTMVWTGRR